MADRVGANELQTTSWSFARNKPARMWESWWKSCERTVETALTVAQSSSKVLASRHNNPVEQGRRFCATDPCLLPDLEAAMTRLVRSTTGRTVSRLARARTSHSVPGVRGDVRLEAFENDIALAARAQVPVLVTANTLALARRVACAIQRRLEPRRTRVAVLDCAVVDEALVELLNKHPGSVVLENVASLGDRAQANLLGFLEQRSGSLSAGSEVHPHIISTALPNLYSSVKAGKFREALFYRLNVIHISASVAHAAVELC